MTSSQLRSLRCAIAIDPFALASTLGVHVSTIYRWESAQGEIKPDPIQAEILARLDRKVSEQPAMAKVLGRMIHAYPV